MAKHKVNTYLLEYSNTWYLLFLPTTLDLLKLLKHYTSQQKQVTCTHTTIVRNE